MAVIVGSAFLVQPAQAVDGVAIANAGKLKWIVDANRVYLCNREAFDPSFRGCCYNYYIDITTDTGKAQFATLLTFYAAHLPLSIYVEDKNQPGRINFLGPI